MQPGTSSTYVPIQGGVRSQDGGMGTEYPALDREAARHDHAVLEAWERAVREAYLALTRDAPSFGGEHERDADPRLAAFERRADADREWAQGYRRGVADAGGGSGIGPGIRPDDRDGWEPSLTRQEGYAAGLADGA